MSEFPVPLDNLIAYVKAQHPDGGPLENVADAFAVSARLDERSDALIGYFVDQARRSGASWSQIGAAMRRPASWPHQSRSALATWRQRCFPSLKGWRPR
jgi:hypothetical protein